MTIVRNELKKAAAKQQTQQRQLQSEISLSGIQVDLTGIRLKSWFFFCFFSLVQEQVWPQRYRYKGTQIHRYNNPYRGRVFGAHVSWGSRTPTWL